MNTRPASVRLGRAAFTLIELLAVIAIISILAAILFPAVGSAMSKARETRCVSQVRQIVTARQLFVADNDGNLMPNRPPWPDDAKGVCTWRWYLTANYGIGPESFVCRAAPNAYTEAGRSEAFAPATSDVKANYTQIGEVYGNDSKSRRRSLIGSPSRQVELIETRDFWADMNMGSWGWIWADGYGVYGYWHGGRATAGYADGHVEVKKLSATATPDCGWDTPAGPHDGAQHPEYRYMLGHYK